MAMRSLPSIAESEQAGKFGSYCRSNRVAVNSPNAWQVRAQQVEHGERVSARAAINGQPFND